MILKSFNCWKYTCLIGLLLLIVSCKKETEKTDLLLLETNSVTGQGATENGVTFSARMLAESDDEPIQQGFVYGLKAMPKVLSDAVVYANFTDNFKFSVKATDALVPDTTYFLRCFIRTEDYIVYGNEVTFRSSGSLPPVIEKIEPQTSFWGDTITIVGQRFDRLGRDSRVLFNEFKALRVWGSSDTIHAVVPQQLNAIKCKIKVELYGQTSQEEKELQLHPPVIQNVSKTTGQFPEILTIRGDYFNPTHGQIYIGGKLMKTVTISRKEINFTIPYFGDAQVFDISYKHLDQEVVAISDFKYNKQAILGLSTDSIYSIGNLVVYSNNLDLRTADLIMKVNNILCTRISIWKDSAAYSYELPYQLYSEKNFTVALSLDDVITGTEKTIASYSVANKKPKITSCLTPQTIYNGKMSLAVEGYCGSVTNFKFFNNNGDVITRNAYLDNSGFFECVVPEGFEPGKHKVMVVDNGRESNVVEFEVLIPQIDFCTSGTITRGDKIIVKGKYLPENQKYFQLKNIQTEEIVSFEDYQSLSTSFESHVLFLLGDATYQLQIKMGNTIINAPNLFSINDYLEKVFKFNPANYDGKTMLCFAINGKIYLRNYNSASFDIIDLNSGTITNHETNNSFFKECHGVTSNIPIIYNGDIYTLADSTVYLFDKESVNWVSIDMPYIGCKFKIIGSGDACIVAIDSKRQYWRYSGSWSLVGHVSFDYLKYIFEHGNYLYSYDGGYVTPYMLSDIATGETPIQSLIGRHDTYYCYVYHFLYKNEMYESLYDFNYIGITKFSPDLKKYVSMVPDFLPTIYYDSYQFCPDVNGDVYFINYGRVYKFNPE